MPDVGTPSLDQLRVFVAVVEQGSFAAAGRALRRATSAVSYTIAHLEKQLGLSLFDREQTRKPVLTTAGTALLAKARAVSAGVDELRATVKGMVGGLEAEVSLVVDVMLPTSRLLDAIQAFEAKFPTVPLRLHVEALGAVAQLVSAGVVGIGIAGSLHTAQAGLALVQVGSVEMIPVAAPSHPLASASQNRAGDARRHRQLVLTVRSPFVEAEDVGIFGRETWRLADLGAKHTLLLAGMGWGHMPEPAVHDDIAAGRLVHLKLPETTGGSYDLQAIYRDDNPPGPAAAWMIERFASQRLEQRAKRAQG
jgi:DNA-binding transcriptional LysR family regulator